MASTNVSKFAAELRMPADVLLEQLRAAGGITLPTSIERELATNPFMRAPSAAEFGSLRQAKDSFR